MKGPVTALVLCALLIAVLVSTVYIPGGWRQNAPLRPELRLDDIDCPMDYTDHISVLPKPVWNHPPNGKTWNPKIHYKTSRNASLLIDGRIVKNGQRITIAPDTRVLKMDIQSGSFTENWRLYFTTLPVIQIHADIIEPHKNHMGMMRLLEPGQNESPEYIAIKQKIRGHSALRDPKRPIGITLFKRSMSFLGMRDDDDWILDALWTDPSFIRNRLVFDLYRAIPKNYETIGTRVPDGRMVEVFQNHRYFGLFFLMEKVDRKLLRLEPDGYIYKPGNRALCDFRSSGKKRPDQRPEAGFSIRHPKPSNDSDFEDLRKLVRFISRGDQTDFDAGIMDLVNIDNLIDHTLLVWAGASRDNLSHNYYLTKNRKGLFYILPWDNEVSFGCSNEEKRLAPDFNLIAKANRMQLMLLNSEKFRSRLKNRWKDLRQDVFSVESIHHMVDVHFQNLIESGAARRDRDRWNQNYPPIDEEFKFLKSFIAERMAFLDHFFKEKLEANGDG